MKPNLANLQDSWEQALSPWFDRAGLSAYQQECFVLWAVYKLSASEIRLKLHLKSGRDVHAFIGQATAKLSSLTGFWDASRQFERDLIAASEGKDDHEERPDGVRGVTPDRASDRFQGARVVGYGDVRILQDVNSAAQLWANRAMPTLAGATTT